MPRPLAWLTNAFPLWVVALSTLALYQPDWFTWFGPWIVWGLTIIMLGMGLTLTIEDFRGVTRMPKAVALAFLAQFTVMPALGWAAGRLFSLETPFAVGLILVACCPGGTASNVVTYLARANVCLSVVMTMCSTFAAVLMTPLLTSWLAGTLVQVDAWGLVKSTFQVVLLPVVLGVWLNRIAPRLVQRVQAGLPLVSVIAIALICASIIGASAPAVKGAALRLLGAVFTLHAGGFALGYAFARLAGFDRIVARTTSIEVGMQNSGLGVFLARQHFADHGMKHAGDRAWHCGERIGKMLPRERVAEREPACVQREHRA
jgi:bile acid:Na+ symporter, BASS family